MKYNRIRHFGDNFKYEEVSVVVSQEKTVLNSFHSVQLKLSQGFGGTPTSHAWMDNPSYICMLFGQSKSLIPVSMETKVIHTHPVSLIAQVLLPLKYGPGSALSQVAEGKPIKIFKPT